MNNKRCEWLDCAKGLAIVLVVLGHSFQYYLYPDGFGKALPWRIVYAFHMPFFFLLSGFSSGLSKSLKFSRDTLVKKLKRLAVPYFAWGVLLFPVSYLYRGWSWDLITDLVVNPSRVGLWYLWTLFFIWLFHALILRLVNNGSPRQLSYIIVWGSLLLVAKLTSGICCLNEISFYFMFYVIGYELCKHTVIKDTPPSNINSNLFYMKRILIGAIVFTALICAQNNVNSVIAQIIKYLLGITGSYIFVYVACFISVSYHRLSECFQMYGKRTLGIYALDTYIIIAAAMLLNHNIFLYPIALIADLAGAFVLTGLLDRYHVTSRLLLGEYKR